MFGGQQQAGSTKTVADSGQAGANAKIDTLEIRPTVGPHTGRRRRGSSESHTRARHPLSTRAPLELGFPETRTGRFFTRRRPASSSFHTFGESGSGDRAVSILKCLRIRLDKGHAEAFSAQSIGFLSVVSKQGSNNSPPSKATAKGEENQTAADATAEIIADSAVLFKLDLKFSI